MTDLSMHPCFGEEGSLSYGRLHIPCAPRCNLRCAFCGGGVDNGETNLPGRTTQIVLPQEAEAYVSERLTANPEIKVIGIAGPGEPLYNPETFEVLALMQRRFPDKMICLGTNGSLLPQNAERLWSFGVKTLTVTVNALTPQVSAKLTPWADGPKGEEAGRQLISCQLEGIERATMLGMTVKVNTVLVPDVNEGEMRSIAEAVRARGAAIQNVMPLRPAGRLADCIAPSPAKLHALRGELAKILPQLYTCTQCRADACGLLNMRGDLPGCLK